MRWLVRVGVIIAVVATRVVGSRDWEGSLLLVTGWLVGYLLAEADHLFYVAVCNPQELACQRVRWEIEKRDFRKAWELLRTTAAERTRLPVHNLVTGAAVTGLGWWVAGSGGSWLAAGAVTGLGVRLWTDMASDPRYQGWYWPFGREFTAGENRFIVAFWAASMAGQLLLLAGR